MLIFAMVFVAAYLLWQIASVHCGDRLHFGVKRAWFAWAATVVLLLMVGVYFNDVYEHYRLQRAFYQIGIGRSARPRPMSDMDLFLEAMDYVAFGPGIL